MTTTPDTKNVHTTGATVFMLNAKGANRWSCLVQPGFNDDGSRVSDAECQAIATAIAQHLNGAAAVGTVPGVNNVGAAS